MVLTLICLLLAHVTADFALQTNKMVATRHTWQGLCSHGAIVALTTLIALGGGHWTIFAGIVVSHIAMDFIKARYLPRQFWAFVLDQVFHIGILVCAALLIGDDLRWATYTDTLTVPITLLTGLMVTTFMGGPIIGALMTSLPYTPKDTGIDGAGKIIGILERGLIFGLVVSGEPGAVGFLIAAKSVLRYDTVKKSQSVSEYVIIGTLASFAWAFGLAYGTGYLTGTLAGPSLSP